ncbi:MAG: hypothetical protein U9R06_01810 [Patescibacteria group bacterium]|nr:hypothetical protein [Patescibacteria group bacterium]
MYEIFYFWSSTLYVVAALGLIIFLFAARQFLQKSQIKERWWNIVILPSSFFLGTLLFVILLTSNALVQLLFIVNVFFLHLYFRGIYYILLGKQEERNYSLENLSSYGNFLTFYFISSAIFGFQSYLHVSVWILMLLLLFSIALIVYQVFWANKISLNSGFFYIVLYGAVLVEIAWSISFLSLSFYILGLILAICYYILIGLARFYLLGNLNAKIVKLYLGFGLASILMVLFTSRWL